MTLVVGVESRTSSPVRVPRDPDTLMHPRVQGLFPSGEGAGYAGGIISAAMDGERCAERVAGYMKQKWLAGKQLDVSTARSDKDSAEPFAF